MADIPVVEAPKGGAIALSPLPVGGRRHGSKKLRLVKKKTVRRMLKKMGLKMRGGVETTTPEGETQKTEETGKVMGGRRRKHTKKTHRRRSTRRLFGIRY